MIHCIERTLRFEEASRLMSDTPPTEGTRLILRTDGASRGNPGHAAAGIVIQRESGEVIVRDKRYLGELTNNQAEYLALIEGLRAVAALKPAVVTVKMDSELVVKQMRGDYRVRSPELLPLYHEAQALVAALPQVRFAHVMRGENKLADALANEALDERARRW